jgi:dTDP-4-dehydrorhamnose reductase
MIVTEMGNRKTHVGKVVTPIEGTMQILSTETMEAEDKAFILRLRDAAKVAIDEEMFQQVVNKLQQSEGQKLTGNPGDVVKLASKVYDFNKDEQTGILRHLVEGGDLSKYGLANAITRTSADLKDYDRATEFEEIVWKAAIMENELWEQLNGKAYML